jgi:tripartite-type tricarboxylate transporter receptor subunit TctC
MRDGLAAHEPEEATMRRPSARAAITTLLGLVAATMLAVPPVAAQDKYPSRPIEFIVPWGPGGGADQVARKIGQLVEPTLKVSLPVVNVPGATGQTGHAKLLAANADGYTLEVMTGDTFALAAMQNSPIKLNDFIPLGVVIQQASAFFVAGNSPMKNWADVQAEAKKRPLKVAITGFNSPDDLTTSYYVSHGLKLDPVPYAKPGERYTSIIGGHADLLYEQLGDVRNFVDSKQIRPVILFYGSKVDAFPDVPTSASLGDKVTLPQFRVILVKAGTDPARVKLLADAIAHAANSDEFKTYLKDQYADPQSFVPADKVRDYMAGWLEQAHALMAAIPAKK